MSIWQRLRRWASRPARVESTYKVLVWVKNQDGLPLAEALVVWDGLEPGNGLTNEQGEFWLPPRKQQGFNIIVRGPVTDPAIGEWEEFIEGVPLTFGRTVEAILNFIPAPVKPKGRTGVPLIVKRTFADGDGKYLPLGVTLFWFLWGYQNDRDRLRANLNFLKERGVDFIRALALVGGESWADRAATPAMIPLISEATEWLYQTFGLRVEWTLFGGVDDTPTPAMRRAAVIQIADQLIGNAGRVQFIEIANEGWQNGFEGETGTAELKDLTKLLRSEGVVNALATTAPQGVSSDEARKYFDGSAAGLATLHLDRSTGGTGGMWRPERQAREGQGTGLPWVNNEPIGPQSSVAEDDDPERLSVGAALTWLCQGAAHVYHPGAGVRGGGLWDVKRGRAANFWEVRNIEEALGAIKRVRELLPADLPNWQWWNGNRAAGAGHPFDGAVLQDNDQLLLRAFAATNGDEFVVIPIGITGAVPFVAKKGMVFEVYNWRGELLETVNLFAGESFTLTPRGSAYFIGRNV